MKLSHLKFQIAKFSPQYFKSLKNDGIFTDFIFVGFLQSLNLLIPLLLVPYLIKVYGVENYGWIVICQSFANYLIIITDYGFNLTAVREASVHREDKGRLSSIYTSVLSIKLAIFGSLFLLLLLSKMILPQFQTAIDLFILSSLGIAFQVLFPVWLFQGIGKIKLGTAILVAGRLLHALLFFLLTSGKSPLSTFFYLQAVSYLLVFIAGLIIINSMYNIRFRMFEKAEISRHLREGWNVYVSNISINIYTGSGALILGIFHGTKAAGIFGIADQVLALLRYPISIFIRVVYPEICLLAVQANDKIRSLFKKTITPIAAIYIIACSLIFIFAAPISAFFSKDAVKEVSVLVRIFCILPLPVLLLNVPPYLIFLAHRLDKINTKVIVAGAVLGLLLNLVLSYFFAAVGSAFSVIITELFVGISLSVILKNKYPVNSLF